MDTFVEVQVFGITSNNFVDFSSSRDFRNLAYASSPMLMQFNRNSDVVISFTLEVLIKSILFLN